MATSAIAKAVPARGGFIKYPALSKIKPAAAPQGAAIQPTSGYVVQTPDQLGAAAAAQAHNELAPSVTAINQGIDQNRQTTRSDIAAIAGLNAAAGGMLRGIGPSIQQGYRQGARDDAVIGKGLAADVTQRGLATDRQAAALASRLGQNFQAPVDQTAAGNAVYELTGLIPGVSLESQGAAARAYGAGLLGAQASTARDMGTSRLAQEHTDNARLTQQLQVIAEKYPALRDQALATLTQLQNQGIATANSTRATDANISHLQHADTLATQAEGRYETALGYTHDYQMGSIQAREDAIKASAASAAARNQQFDKNRSIAYGYAVDKTGKPYLDQNGKRIPVKASDFSTTSAKGSSKSFQSAVSDAKSLRPTPLRNTSGYGGTYIAAPGAKGAGVIKGVGSDPATTNNPAKAQQTSKYTFAQAIDYLMARRNITRRQARKALIAAGWKPDGKRPPSDIKSILAPPTIIQSGTGLGVKAGVVP